MNTNLLEVVTLLSIYNGFSNSKTFWKGKCTGEEKFTLGEFTAVKMKCFGRRNVRKHREIKGSDKYVTLYISLKFGSMEKMRIPSSEPKYSLVRPGKVLITSLCLRSKSSPNKYKKARFAIIIVNIKDLLNIISEFEKFTFIL